MRIKSDDSIIQMMQESRSRRSSVKNEDYAWDEDDDMERGEILLLGEKQEKR